MKSTWNPKKKIRLRKHGFLTRQKYSSFVLNRRRSKGRWRLCPAFKVN